MTASLEVGQRSARVLIVDDEIHNRTLMEVMLSPEGFVLQTAISGEEALADGGGGCPGSHPARHHDARDRRLSGRREDQGRPRHREHPRDHGDRPGRLPVEAVRIERGGRRLHHQTRRSARPVRTRAAPAAAEGAQRLPGSVSPDPRKRRLRAHRRSAPGARARPALPRHAGRHRGGARSGGADHPGEPLRLLDPGLDGRGAAGTRLDCTVRAGANLGRPQGQVPRVDWGRAAAPPEPHRHTRRRGAADRMAEHGGAG